MDISQAEIAFQLWYHNGLCVHSNDDQGYLQSSCFNGDKVSVYFQFSKQVYNVPEQKQTKVTYLEEGVGHCGRNLARLCLVNLVDTSYWSQAPRSWFSRQIVMSFILYSTCVSVSFYCCLICHPWDIRRTCDQLTTTSSLLRVDNFNH